MTQATRQKKTFTIEITIERQEILTSLTMITAKELVQTIILYTVNKINK
jgi:hypothetical protein